MYKTTVRASYFAVCLVAAFLQSYADAQSFQRGVYSRLPERFPEHQSGTYRPSRPTFTPYLNYFRRDSGALDRFNAIVNPTIQQQLEFRIQRQSLIRQGGVLRQNQIDQSQRQQEVLNQLAPQQHSGIQTIRPSQAAPTGTSSIFFNRPHYFNYSHYYTIQQPTGR